MSPVIGQWGLTFPQYSSRLLLIWKATCEQQIFGSKCLVLRFMFFILCFITLKYRGQIQLKVYQRGVWYTKPAPVGVSY